MKAIHVATTATLAASLVLALSACSPGGEKIDPAAPSPDIEVSSAQTQTPLESEPGSGSGTQVSVKESCEEFNTLQNELRATEPSDSAAMKALSRRSLDAKAVAPADTSFLFLPQSLLALDFAAEGKASEDTQGILKDAVFAAASACSAAAVTLTL